MFGFPMTMLGLPNIQATIQDFLDRVRRVAALWVGVLILAAMGMATAIVALAWALYLVFLPELGAAGAAAATAGVYLTAVGALFLIARRQARWMMAPIAASRAGIGIAAGTNGHAAAAAAAAAMGAAQRATDPTGAPAGAPAGMNGHAPFGSDSPLWNVATLVALGVIAGLSRNQRPH